jgi:hypothetical protein
VASKKRLGGYTNNHPCLSGVNMNKLIPTEVKKQDILNGFLVWALLSNFVFLLFTSSIAWDGRSEESVSKIFWLLTITVILVLFMLKKVWVGTGVTAAVITNIGLWTLILFLFGLRNLGVLFYNLRVISAFPLPLGLIILIIGSM